MQTKTQLQLILENETLKELNAISYDANARLSKENKALLAKNKELEEELQERKAYIVANPCAQCGGKINAMKCDAWAKKAKELEEKLKNNDMSKPEPKIDMKKECVEPVSIWKDVSELPEVDHDCVICTNRGKMAFAMYQHTDKSFLLIKLMKLMEASQMGRLSRMKCINIQL
jgi:hypothetical protein